MAPASGLRRTLRAGLPLVLLLLVVAVVLRLALYQPDYFSDNQYNLGVALHSALPNTRWLLETTAVNFFFTQLDAPRPESWHRGLYILLLSGWARLVGSHSELLLRLPHAAIVLGWLAAVAGLAGTLLKGPDAEGATWRRVLWVTAGFGVFALAFESRWWVLSRAWLDDLPATVCVVTGVAVIAAGELTRRRLLVGGACLGVAAFTKDLYLLWGPIAVATVLLTSDGPGRDRVRRAGWLALAFGFVLVPRFVWSTMDLGKPLANPIRSWMNLWMFGHQHGQDLFFLTGDNAHTSPLAAAHGDWNALVYRFITRPFAATKQSLGEMWPAWALLAVGMWWSRRRVRLTRATRVALTFLGTSVMLQIVFCIAGFAAADQLRYWSVPVTLAATLGLTQLMQPARKGAELRSGGYRVAAGTLTALLVLEAAATGWILQSVIRRPPGPPMTAAAVRSAHRWIADGGAIVIGPGPADYYYRRHPQDTVVVVPPDLLASHRPDIIQRLTEIYDIRVVASHGRGLRFPGFVGKERTGGVSFFVRDRPAPPPAPLQNYQKLMIPRTVQPPR